MNKAVYYFIFGLLKLLSYIPLRVLYCLSDILLYPCLYYLVGYRRAVVTKNLRNAFPDKTDKERKKIARVFYHHFCDTMVEVVAFMSISEKNMKRRVVYKNTELVHNHYANEKSIVFVMSHYGNWEWACSYALHSPMQMFTAYKPLRNRVMDKIFLDMRTRLGMIPVEKKKMFRRVVVETKQNKRFGLVLIADQNPSPGDALYWTTFMEQDAPFFTGPETIARALNLPVVYADMRYLKRGYYEIEFVNLVTDSASTGEHEITEMYVRYLESILRKQPEYFFWTHNRWKRHKEPNT